MIGHQPHLTTAAYERGCLASVDRDGEVKLTNGSRRNAWAAAWSLVTQGILESHDVPGESGSVVFRRRKA